jgi:hypothetical protein
MRDDVRAELGRRLSFVTTGLDPVVHAEAQLCRDCRIKSGNDARKRSRGAFAPESCSTKNESHRSRSRQMAAGGGTGIIWIISGARNQEGGTPADA